MKRIWLPIILLSLSVSEAATSGRMVKFPASKYVPFVLKAESKQGQPESFKKTPVQVPEFSIDPNLITNDDFMRFVSTRPEWQRSKVKAIFADQHYLQHWKGDLELATQEDGLRPVTNVSWFAARAYCESLGKELPTNDQWEVAYLDRGRDKKKTKEAALAWYGKPSSSGLGPIGSGSKNKSGINDLSTLVWEWTLDFNSFLAGDELRSGGNDKSNTGQFCGGGALGVLDGSDYVAFMRYSFRASLKAAYTTGNLGFRCAMEKQ